MKSKKIFILVIIGIIILLAIVVNTALAKYIASYDDNLTSVNITIPSCTLTIKYINQDTNTEIKRASTKNYQEGSSYSVTPSDIADYEYINSNIPLTGTINSNITIILYYKPKYTLTIEYINKENEEIIQSAKKTLYKSGTSYSIIPDTIDNYTYDSASESLSGVLNGNKTITLYYRLKKISITVKYIDKDTGTNIKDDEVIEYKKGDSYNISPPSVPGYTYDSTSGNTSGTINSDTTVTFYYKKKYTITVKYIDKDTGTSIKTQTTSDYKNGASYSITAPTISGYIYDSNNGGLSGTVTTNKTVTVYYKKKYTLTVKYLHKDTNAVLKQQTTIEYKNGASYSISTDDLEDYYFDSASGNTSGTINSNTTVILYYKDYGLYFKAYIGSEITVVVSHTPDFDCPEYGRQYYASTNKLDSPKAGWDDELFCPTHVVILNKVKPKNTKYWFSQVDRITGIENINTSNVTDMSFMFSQSTLTSVDLSGFDTSKVTNMQSMFSSCTKLKTIYASNSFVTTKVTLSSDMFNNCTVLVGGNGTRFNSSRIDKTYARIDRASTPGYFTQK